ncbi:MAG: D-sedoheptulose-7-phosphate isomerase [Acidimicrobiales bacterium]
MSDFLYPFLEHDERDSEALLADLAASAEAKGAESARLAEATVAAADIGAVAREIAARRQVFTFGNGGSATDAEALAARFVESGRAARSLTDVAVITALGNDVGFDLVFSRQLIAHAREGDVAIGLSTSGNSRNVLRAFAEARRLGVYTVGFAGYEGGEMATAADHCFVVRADSVHRIQEAQARLGAALVRAVAEASPAAPARP